MTHPFKLARRTARLRALSLVAFAFALGACNGTDELTDPTSNDPAAIEAPAFAATFNGGIPFGLFHLPSSLYGGSYSGTLVNNAAYVHALISDLEAARQAGVKVVLSMVGAENFYKNSNGTFSLSKWKARLDLYKNTDFSSYINDGTIIGNYMIDEPHDPENWAGTTISWATLDEMARYSKQYWPGMPTIVRSWPAYLKGYDYKYLDVAWAQYSERKGNVADFIKNNVSDSKASGLALIVGMNLLDGGNSSSGIRGYTGGKYAMSAAQIKSWGGTLLDDSYPCAFVSWKYDPSYLSRSDIKAALATLSEKARNRPTKSCRTGAQSAPAEQPPVVQPPVVLPTTDPSSITLSVTKSAQNGKQYMRLTWSGTNGAYVDVYRDGGAAYPTANDGHYTNSLPSRGAVTYRYKICQRGTSVCSNEASVTFN